MNALSKAKAIELLSVSRETLRKIQIFEALLRKWQRGINLVSRHTLDELWLRHIADSGQLIRFAPPTAKIWADVGAGAGFPGAIIGIILAERPGALVHLIERDHSKCAFLHAVSRETGAPLNVHCESAETALARLADVEIVTSRAVASLPVLLGLCGECLDRGGLGIFPKGRTYRTELTSFKPPDSVTLTCAASLTDPEAAIVIAQKTRVPEPGHANPCSCESEGRGRKNYDRD